MENMMEEKFRYTYYVGTNIHSFRSGEAAIIRSIQTYKTSLMGDVICFYVEYADGVTDWCPVSDTSNYKLLKDNEIKFCYKPL
jgi:hypothetical protein